jgi:hypothetical protein
MRSSSDSGGDSPEEPATAQGRLAAALLRLASALALVALIAGCFGTFAYVRWRAARARWLQMSERVLGPGYDAGESDRRYLEVEARRDELVRALEAMAAASAAAAGVLLWRYRDGARRSAR